MAHADLSFLVRDGYRRLWDYDRRRRKEFAVRCPPPLRRTRSLHRIAPDRRSAKPRPMVLRAIPVVRETATIPPRPAARASQAANKRRSLSLRNGPSAL